jgi:hypothetical protein
MLADGSGGVNAGGPAYNARVAQVTVTYWRDIPVLVTARDGAEEATVPLSARFQELVDAVAMQSGLSDSEAYLAEWRTGPGEERTGTAESAANEVAAELEEQFGEVRTRYLRPGGPFDAH